MCVLHPQSLRRKVRGRQQKPHECMKKWEWIRYPGATRWALGFEGRIWLLPTQDENMDGWSFSSPAASVSACWKIKFFTGGQHRRKNQLNKSAGLQSRSIYTIISIKGRSGCTSRQWLHRNWFGHWSVMWPGQDVVMKQGCGRAVVTILLSQ